MPRHDHEGVRSMATESGSQQSVNDGLSSNICAGSKNITDTITDTIADIKIGN